MLTLELVPYYLSAGISLLVAGYAFRWRRPGGIIFFALFALAQSLWTLACTLELRAADAGMRIFWDNIQWIFFSLLGPLFFEFVIAYTHLERVPPRPMRIMLLLPILVFLVMVFTNDQHGLIYSSFEIAENEPFDALVYPYTPPIMAFSLYILGYIMGGMVMLVSRFVSAGIALRNQIAIILFGIWLGITVIFLGAMFDLRLMGQRDWTPLSFALSNAVIAYGIFRNRLFFIVPVARDIIFENLADGVIVLSDSGYILDANNTARVNAAPTVERIVGKHIEQVYPSWKHLFEGLRTVESFHGEVHTPEDTPSRVFDITISPISSHQGDLLARVIIARDITAQHAAELARREQERLRLALEQERALNVMKTHLMQRVTHEFRTPLSIIQLSHDILTRYFFTMEEDSRHEKLSNISRQVDVLTEMLEDIHGSLRGQSPADVPKRAGIDAREMCQQIVDDLTSTVYTGRRVEIEPASGEVLIHVDRYALRIWLSNLISNAIKYSIAEQSVRVRMAVSGSQFKLEVIDQGRGIPPNDLAHIFDPFRRAANADSVSGLGLGLALVRDTVQAHGGEITVTSQVGQGTHFTICIPDVVEIKPRVEAG